MARDIIHSLLELAGFNPEVLTADKNGVTADMKGFQSVMFVVPVGISGDTLSGSVFVELILQAGDLQDGSDAVAVTDADEVLGNTVDSSGVFATIDDPAEDDAIHSIGYRGNKRYPRIAVDLTGTHTNGIPIAVLNLKGDPSHGPTRTA